MAPGRLAKPGGQAKGRRAKRVGERGWGPASTEKCWQAASNHEASRVSIVAPAWRSVVLRLLPVAQPEELVYPHTTGQPSNSSQARGSGLERLAFAPSWLWALCQHFSMLAGPH